MRGRTGNAPPIIQVEAEKEAAEFAAALKARTGIPHIPVYELPPTIVVHAGPRDMGAGFFV